MTELKPGRALDALIAEKVMGHVASKDRSFQLVYDGDDDLVETMPDKTLRRLLLPYSTDIASAWEVVEISGEFNLRREPPSEPQYGPRWRATFNFSTNAYADTAPHAICLAALKACGE